MTVIGWLVLAASGVAVFLIGVLLHRAIRWGEEQGIVDRSHK